MSSPEILDRLAAVIAERARARAGGAPGAAPSYVAKLLDGGHAAIAAKVREESAELVDAAAEGDAAHTAHEAADLLFHVWVLLAHAGVAPAAVFAELERRFGTSGLVEKASRAAGGNGARSGGDAC
ncbi:MAG: phosphoribosyl-ATP diphosphatase [Myxococcota bacterium]